MANPLTQIVLTAVDKTKAAFASVKNGITSLSSSASAFGSQMGLIFTGLSVAGFVGSIKRAVDAMDNAYNSAQKIGTSVENFSALSYAAGQADVPVEELEKSLLKLSRTLDEARSGTGSAAEAFQRLKIDPRQFSDPADALLVIAERFAAMPDGINKAALAMDIFGKGGARLIPFLNQGRAGIEALTAEAKRLGVVMDGEAAAAADKFNDSLDRLSKRGTGVGVTFANKILPSLNQYVGALDDIIDRGTTLDKIRFFTTGYISEDVLNRISDAGERVQDYNAEIFKLQQQLVELRRVEAEGSPNIAIWEKRIADLEKTRAGLAARVTKESKDTSDAWAEDRAAEAAAFKKATNAQISDAERLATALQTAFSASIKAEEDYLRQAKKLRAEANGAGEVGDDPESQARARLDAVAAAMRLQRTASSESLESVQDQADAIRNLAANLTEAALKADLMKQANLAEAAALERAAAEEKARYEELSRQQAETVRQAENMKAAVEGIGKEVSVDIKPGPQTKQLISDLERIHQLIGSINSTPVSPGTGAAGRAAPISDSLSTAALQFGRR